MFQSPRSGKFESNVEGDKSNFLNTVEFQSPRSGKFESNLIVLNYQKAQKASLTFQSPRSGKFESNAH